MSAKNDNIDDTDPLRHGTPAHLVHPATPNDSEGQKGSNISAKNNLDYALRGMNQDQIIEFCKARTENLIAEMDAEKEAEEAKKYAENVAKMAKRIAEIDALLYKGSIQEMLDRFGGIPDLSIVAGLAPHEDTKRHAEFLVDPNFITAEDLKFPFKVDKNLEQNVHETPLWKPIPSFLENVKLRKPEQEGGLETLAYHNEVTVAMYVQNVIFMCLHSLGYFTSCSVSMEMSLFSLRPDLILIRHAVKGIILIIKVKMPGEQMTLSPHIAGQVADYLVLQHRLGNQKPFVLLSSYREACLCHLVPGCLPDKESGKRSENTVLTDESTNQYRLIVEEAAALLRNSEDIARVFGQKESKQGNEQADHSPATAAFADRNQIPIFDDGKKRKRNGGHEPTITAVTPKVVYSKPFNTQNMLEGISLSIVCGLVSLSQKEQDGAHERAAWPSQDAPVGGLHPMVDSACLSWKHVENMLIDYRTPPLRSGAQSSKYLLLQELGMGQDARVFLAVDVHGKACALKFYEGDIDEETPELFETFKESVDEEKNHWQSLQPGHEEYLEVLQLNAQIVLKMPVVSPVPRESRLGVLPDVRNQLLWLFEKKKYVYNALRWQHIGCLRDQATPDERLHIVLLHMGSLECVTTETRAHVETQIKLLQESWSTDGSSGPTSGLLEPAVAT